MQNTEPYIQIVECNTPEELIEWLQSPKKIKFKKGGFIFRGQTDSEWGLKPSVFRQNTITSYKNNSIGPASNLSDQVDREIDLIKAFAQESNRVGLEIPSHLETLLKTDSPLFETYPNPDIIEFMSIAQHYGVPTRLLDFTFDPMVACYFAAADQIDFPNNNRPKSIAVWVVNKFIIDHISRITCYEPIRYRNRYLHAQDGVFILDRGLNAIWKSNSNLFDIDHIIIQEISDKINNNKTFKVIMDISDKKTIYKFTLPFEKRDKLLELLDNSGINIARISPSYDNVVKFLKQQRIIKIKWDMDFRAALRRNLSGLQIEK
jgi:hypothetical protein